MEHVIPKGLHEGRMLASGVSTKVALTAQLRTMVKSNGV